MEQWEIEGWDPAANRALGYLEYRRSSAWQRVRRAVMHRADGRCEGVECSRVQEDQDLLPFDVHHVNYDHIFDELRHLEDVRWLCRNCHRKEPNHEGLRSPPVRSRTDDPGDTLSVEDYADLESDPFEGSAFDPDDRGEDEASPE